ncbi:hypothetical protein [Hydrogenophaga sp.]|uniref:hypothetical protein n=1 Tax=Hydrogenophaga sp. TaxID=1904254 RepID=UPI0035AD8B2E
MMSISSSQSVSWPTAPPQPAAPVPSVHAVGSAQSSRDAQNDSGRNGQGSPRGGAAASSTTVSLRSTEQQPKTGAPSVDPAPLLPRDGSQSEPSSLADEVAQARNEAEQRKAEEQKAREKAEQRVPLQDVIATVWKASAAVVDVVLGRDSTEGLNAGAAEGATASPATGAAPAPAAAVASGSAASEPQTAVQAELPGIEPLPAGLRREQEPVAYNEQGASSWAPMEAGSLFSQRV